MTFAASDRRAVLRLGLGALTMIVGAAAAQAQTPRPLWPAGAAAAVSLTYDDGLNTQLDVVAPELEKRGWRGTFYVTEDNIAERIEDWVGLARRGHEVENHTKSHPCALGRYDAARFDRQEVRPVSALLSRSFPASSHPTYAYPCGFLGLGRGSREARFARYRRLVERDFVAARTTAGGPNDPREIQLRRYDLHAFEPTYEADVAAPAARYLRRTLEVGGWAILVFHDVVPTWRSEGDASVAMHAAVLNMIQAQDFWCAPVGKVLAQLNV